MSYIRFTIYLGLHRKFFIFQSPYLLVFPFQDNFLEKSEKLWIGLWGFVMVLEWFSMFRSSRLVVDKWGVVGVGWLLFLTLGIGVMPPFLVNLSQSSSSSPLSPSELVHFTLPSSSLPFDANIPSSADMESDLLPPRVSVVSSPIFRLQAMAAYTSFSPLSIHNDSHFASLASTYGWLGNGSEVDPYQLTNYEIAGTYSEVLIAIANTSVFFNISDCFLHYGTTAVLFTNVTHGCLQNCTLLDNTVAGVQLVNSSENILYRNTINNSGEWGILSEDSNLTSISSNFIYDHNREGIRLVTSPLMNLSSNTVLFNREEGISLDNSSFCILWNNTVQMSTWDGITVFRSSFTNCTGNWLINNGECGLEVDYSASCFLFNNTCVGNDYAGVKLYQSNHSSLLLLEVFGSIQGIYCTSLTNVSVDRCLTRQSSIGFYLSLVRNASLQHCVALDSPYYGIELSNCPFTSLFDVLISNCSSQGFRGFFSPFLNLSGAVVSECYEGAVVYRCNDSFVENVSATFCDYRGIYFEQSHRLFTADVMCAFNADGFSALFCNDSNFTRFTLVRNDGVGLSLSQMSFLEVSDVYCAYNNASAINIHTSTYSRFTNVTAAFNCQIAWMGAIHLEETSYILFQECQIYNNLQNGFSLSYTHSFVLTRSFVAGNTGHGVYVDYSSDRTRFFCNVFYNNSNYGLLIDFSGDPPDYNSIYFNDFIANGQEGAIDVHLYSSNWQENISHNFYDNFRLPDDDSDGIVDVPYLIYSMEGQYLYDYEPLTLPFNTVDFHYLSSPVLTYPYVNYALEEWEWGEVSLNGTVVLQWLAAIDSRFHSVSYSVLYSSDWGANWTTVVSGLTDTSYSWDTTVVSRAEILLMIKAVCPDGGITYSIRLRCVIDNSPPILWDMATPGFQIGILVVVFLSYVLLSRKR